MNILKILALLFILSYSSLMASAQPDSTFIKQIDQLRKDCNYTEIITAIAQKQKSLPSNLWLTYNKACYYALLSDSTKAFSALFKAVQLGADGKDILTDTDFENIHT
jgi:predicted solute-binding protein